MHVSAGMLMSVLLCCCCCAASGARPGDLAPTSQQELANCGPPLPLVTFVFAEVAATHKLSHKHHKSQLHAVNKAIQRCMLQQTASLTEGDGYMCRSHELKFMVAFESPVRAVQWCLLVQVGWALGWAGLGWD